MFKAIIFDFDGVLVESVDIKTKSFARLFESEGEEVVNKVVAYHQQHCGVSRFDKFKYFYKNILHRKLTDEIFNDLCRKFSEFVVEEVINAPYVKMAKEFLDRNIKNYKFFVCSATPQNELETIIKRRGMSTYFNKVYGSPLPKDEIIQIIFNKSNLSSQEILYIGDSLSDYQAAKDKKIHFIARINNNEHLFSDNILYHKINDFSNLDEIIKNISNPTKVEKNYSSDVKKAYDFLSFINKKAYNDISMLSNQVLSKNPYTNTFLINFLKNKSIKKIRISYIIVKLIRYYFFSCKNFFSYLLEFFEFFFSGMHYQHNYNKKQIVLIDAPFVIPNIRTNNSFRDNYFSDLSNFLKKRNINYCYLPLLDGMKKRFTLFNIFKILKKQNVPLLSEYQLLSKGDLLTIFCFILAYPFSVLRIIRFLDVKIYEQSLLRDELVKTLDDITFMSFSRYLQGKKISRLHYSKIKVISWCENQVVNKNLYKGLRSNTSKTTIYGAQLFLYSKNELNIVIDENETMFGIVPDKIVVNGKWFIPKTKKLKFVVGPSLRYAKIFTTKINSMEKRRKILISLPYQKDEAINILKIIGVLKSSPYHIFVKPHPIMDTDEYRKFFAKKVNLTSGDLYEIFKTTRIIIGGATGTLVEAASLGIPAIFITNHNVVKGNPLPIYGKGLIWEEACNQDELKLQFDKFDARLKNNSYEIKNTASFLRKNLFCEPTEENIARAFDLLTPNQLY